MHSKSIVALLALLTASAIPSLAQENENVARDVKEVTELVARDFNGGHSNDGGRGHGGYYGGHSKPRYRCSLEELD
ncbi:hypothetical protein C8Q75DRAFT_807161 [Abortiporus biennis]|nr:hypothetical protein C8Q75DRAFT_807161 [Abortiporus biennis]